MSTVIYALLIWTPISITVSGGFMTIQGCELAKREKFPHEAYAICAPIKISGW